MSGATLSAFLKNVSHGQGLIKKWVQLGISCKRTQEEWTVLWLIGWLNLAIRAERVTGFFWIYCKKNGVEGGVGGHERRKDG